MAYQPQPRRYKPFKRRTPDFRCLYDNLLRALEDKSGQQLTHLLSQPHFNSDALLRCRPWEKSLLVSAIEKHNFCCVEILVNTPHILFHVKQVQAFEAVFEEPMEKTRVRLFYILMKSEQVKLNRLISSVLPYVNTEQDEALILQHPKMVVDARLPIWQQIAAEDQNEDPDENIQHFKKRPQFTLGISFAFWKFTLHDAFPVAFHQSVMVMLLAAGRFSICLPVEVWREFIIPHLCFHAWSV